MKTFSRILSEVAQPNSEDELNFKEKHVIDPIDHTVAPESTFSGNVDKDDIDGMKRYRKNKRLADYQRPDDEDVYEAVSLKRDIPGQEDNDVDNDGDDDMTDAQLKYRRHAQIKLHKIDETVYIIPEEILATEKNAFHTAAANAHAAGKKHFAFAGKKYPVTMSKGAAKTFAGKGGMSEAMDPVGKEDDDINNDGKVNKSDKYLHARRKAISASIRTKIKEAFGPVTAAGGDYDEEPSHQRYKKSNSSKSENITMAGGKGSKIYAGKTKESQIDEAMSLDKHNKVHADSGAEAFAKDYVKGNKGDYTDGGPTEKHQKDSEKFHNTYKHIGGKSGYGGSGHDIYQHNATGEKFRVDRNATGKGFYGTDHMVSKLNEGSKLSVDDMKKALDSASAQPKNKVSLKKAPWETKKEEVELEEAVPSLSKAYMMKLKSDYHDKKSLSRGETQKMHKELGTHTVKNLKHIAGAGIDHISQAAKQIVQKQFEPSFQREEVELGELKKSTLGSYVRKSSIDAYRKGQDVEYHTGARSATDNYGSQRRHAELTDKARSKASNRITGIERATKQLAKEDINEAFGAGSVKLNDGSSVMLKAQDAKLLNDLMNGLKSENKSKMMKVAMTDKHGFNEILGFAREAL
jgi:hypothetical protein